MSVCCLSLPLSVSDFLLCAFVWVYVRLCLSMSVCRVSLFSLKTLAHWLLEKSKFKQLHWNSKAENDPHFEGLISPIALYVSVNAFVCNWRVTGTKTMNHAHTSVLSHSIDVPQISSRQNCLFHFQKPILSEYLLNIFFLFLLIRTLVLLPSKFHLFKWLRWPFLWNFC